MEQPGTTATVWRIAVALVVMIGPTLLFLGLVRGLETLRNDAFIEQWLRETDQEVDDDVLSVLASGIGLESGGSEPGASEFGGTSSRQCPGCGASVPSAVRYCRECLEGP